MLNNKLGFAGFWYKKIALNNAKSIGIFLVCLTWICYFKCLSLIMVFIIKIVYHFVKAFGI